MQAVIIDTETTGIDDAEPIEIAWVDADANTSTQPVTCARFQPSKPITLGAMATHHIIDEDLIGLPPPWTFNLPAGVGYIIGHNVDFDWNAIGKPDVKRICTCAMARKLWPAVDSYSLGALLYHLDRHRARERLQGAHSAAADVVNCALLLKAIISEVGWTNWDELWRYSEGARIPATMPFGKHKGAAIRDVPRDYVRWLLNQPDVDPYLQKALRAA